MATTDVAKIVLLVLILLKTFLRVCMQTYFYSSTILKNESRGRCSCSDQQLVFLLRVRLLVFSAFRDRFGILILRGNKICFFY